MADKTIVYYDPLSLILSAALFRVNVDLIRQSTYHPSISIFDKAVVKSCWIWYDKKVKDYLILL